MQVCYQLTESDFRGGMIAYRHRRRLSRWAYRFGIATTAVLAILCTAMLFIGGADRNIVRNLAPLLGLMAFWILILWVSPYLSARSQFRGSRHAQGPKTLQVSATELNFQSEHGDSRLLWSGFVGWAEEKQVFALFTNPKVFVVLPKRAFTAEQIVEFRELLRQNIR